MTKVRGHICIRRRAKDGATGPTGPAGKSIRNTVWATGKQYCDGTTLVDGVYPLDIVSDKALAIGTSGVNFYMCVRTHTSSASIPLTNTSYWTKLNSLRPIVTYLILAEAIKASFIDVDDLVANSVLITKLIANSTFTDTLGANSAFISKLLATSAFIDNLVAKKIATGTSSGLNTAIQNGTFQIKNGSTVRASFGINTSGEVILAFYDANGNEIYDLGPGGLKESATLNNPQWLAIKCHKLASSVVANWPTAGINKVIYSYTNPTTAELATVHGFIRNQPDTMYQFTDGSWSIGSVLYYINPFGHDPDLMSSHSSINEDYFDSVASLPQTLSYLETNHALTSGYNYIAINSDEPYSQSSSSDGTNMTITVVYTGRMFSRNTSNQALYSITFLRLSLTIVANMSDGNVSSISLVATPVTSGTQSYES